MRLGYLLAAEVEDAVDEPPAPTSFGLVLVAVDEQAVPWGHEEPEVPGGQDGEKEPLAPGTLE